MKKLIGVCAIVGMVVLGNSAFTANFVDEDNGTASDKIVYTKADLQKLLLAAQAQAENLRKGQELKGEELRQVQSEYDGYTQARIDHDAYIVKLQTIISAIKNK